DGTYQGAASMIVPPVGKSGASGAPITVRALNDGGVFIDGQFVNPPFWARGNSFWVFEGFDVGNSPDGTGTVQDTTNSVLKRLCFSNIKNATPGINGHVLLVW